MWLSKSDTNKAEVGIQIQNKRLKCGFDIPIFGTGTWMMGGDFYYDTENDDIADIDAIKTAIELGITYIDSSELYAQGHAEELVAKAIKGYEREKLFICTKVSPLNLRYNDLIKAAKKSLERLDTDYIDLYLMHFPNKNIPLEETMPALDKLVNDGLIKYIGVSNFTVDQMKEAQSYSKHKIVANQYHYNLIVREPERNGLLEYCQKNDVILIAWRPVQDVIIHAKGIEVLEKICAKYSKTPVQIGINWLISQDNVVTLAKSRNVNHLQENLEGVGWQMDESDIEMLRANFPNQRDIGDAWTGLERYIKI